MIIKKLGTAIATAAILGSVMAPVAAFADTTVDVTGNGAGSTNYVNANQSNTTVVDQTNITKSYVKVNAKANTGGNSCSDNTGGDCTIDTGMATNDVTVSVTGGNNTATVAPCGCDTTTDVTVADNGADTHNTVKAKKTNTVVATQFTKTKSKVKTRVKAKTGNNVADANTNGSNSITTNDAANTVDVTVGGGSNVLNP